MTAVGDELARVPPWLLVIFGTMLGALIGSFLGAVLSRLPERRSVIVGGSACDRCGIRLGPAELIPLISFVVQRGRCRRCGAPIDRWQLGAEAGAALVGLGAVLAASDLGTFVLGAALGWQLLLLALLDLRHFWLPRGLVLLLAATSLVAAIAQDRLSLPLVAEMLAGGALGFAMLWLIAALYRRVRGREGMGGGDPALLGAIGLWVGPAGVVATVLGGSLAGLTGAALLALAGRKVGATTALPLGAALALAGWGVWLLQNR